MVEGGCPRDCESKAPLGNILGEMILDTRAKAFSLQQIKFVHVSITLRS